MGLLRFDQSETVWFAVYAADGSFIAGDSHLAPGVVAAGSSHAFSHLSQDGREMRRATGLLMAFGSGLLSQFLALDAAITQPAGLFLIVWAAGVAALALRPRPDLT